MPAQHSAQQRRVDSDGVVRVDQPRAGIAVWVLGLGIALTCVSLGLSAWLLFDTPEVEEPPVLSQSEPPPVAQAPPPAPPPVRPAVAPARPVVRPALPRHVEAQVAAVPEEVLEQLPEDLYEMPEPGAPPTGMMLFPPPGTDPPKKGILVPEDFELPPGYVRHYQATDDGERLPAILMFHPDSPPLDASGQPMKVPENLVVPPELAPPGMPLQIMDPEKQGRAEQSP